MIRCEHALDQLWDFLDGELPPEDSAAVQRHLELCNRCYPQYDFRRAHLEFVRRLRDRQHVPAAFRSALFQMILAQDAQRPLEGE